MGITLSYNGLGGKVKFSGTSGKFKTVYINPPLLLDIYPSAAAAYSLRKLKKTYTGSAIRVRRTSDNVEQDIGFVNNVLDTASLSTFIGANSGCVTTWYDQSGNSKNAVQTITSRQPLITISGVLQTQNSKPTIRFVEPSINFLGLSSTFTGTAGTLIHLSATLTDPVGVQNGAVFGSIGAPNDNSNSHNPWTDGIIYDTFATTIRKTVGNPTNNTSVLYIYNAVSDNNLFDVKINNTNFYNTATNTVGYNTDTQYLPKIGGSLMVTSAYYFQGYISEAIVYTSNQLSNLSGINTNINSYYTIY